VLPLAPIVTSKTSLPAAFFTSFHQISNFNQSLSWKFAKTKKASYRRPGFVVFVEAVSKMSNTLVEEMRRLGRINNES
jgi:hypothetical protein